MQYYVPQKQIPNEILQFHTSRSKYSSHFGEKINKAIDSVNQERTHAQTRVKRNHFERQNVARIHQIEQSNYQSPSTGAIKKGSQITCNFHVKIQFKAMLCKKLLVQCDMHSVFQTLG